MYCFKSLDHHSLWHFYMRWSWKFFSRLIISYLTIYLKVAGKVLLFASSLILLMHLFPVGHFICDYLNVLFLNRVAYNFSLEEIQNGFFLLISHCEWKASCRLCTRLHQVSVSMTEEINMTYIISSLLMMRQH